MLETMLDKKDLKRCLNIIGRRFRNLIKMRTVELFAGTQSFSKVAKELGHETFTVEINDDQNPDLCKDILETQREDLPEKIDILWASPPCTTFSVASLRWYWDNRRPKNSKTWHGISMILKTIQLIEEIKKDNPDLIWFIENPRGMLRKQSFMKDFNRNTVTYCQYGDFRQKPTDIWTNCKEWVPRPVCSPGSPCHNSARRGSDTGTQGIGGGGKNGARDRSRIPPALFHEIFKSISHTN